jgi:hypothetical protein
LDRLEINDLTPNVISAVPKRMDEEDIREHDVAFEHGLYELGMRFGVPLYLPYWAYEK